MKGTGILQLPLGWKRMAPLAAVALAAALMLPGTSLAATPTPVTWRVDVGGQSPDKGRQTNFFFNRDITVNVGDTVQWTQAANEIHTVTFLAGTAAPPLFTPAGNGITPNPAAVAPSGGPNFDGSTLANSGLLQTPGTDKFDLTFTKPGDYNYVCLVHSKMTGVVHVQPQGRAYPQTQAQYDLQSRILRATYGAQATTLQAVGLIDAVTKGPTQNTVGIGQLLSTGSLAVLRFLPSQNMIRVGQTVTWTNRDPETPHTVTFGTEPPGGPFGAFPPSGTDPNNPGHATISSPTQSVNSGFILNGLTSATFQATFTRPGTYSYICALHDDLGMVGTITVLR